MILSNKNNNFSLQIWLFILFLVASSDRLGIMVGGAAIKPLWILLFPIALIMLAGKIEKTSLAYAAVFFIFHLTSLFLNNINAHGLIYSAQIIVFYILFFNVAYSISRRLHSVKTLQIISISGRFQIICSILLCILKVDARATFLYYEPSYMAIALIPYTMLVISQASSKKVDLLFIAGFLYFGGSANYLLILIIAILIVTLSGGLEKSSIFKSMAIGSLVLLVFLAIALFGNKTNSAFIQNNAEKVNFEDFGLLLIDRTGNRVPRLITAFDAVVENPIFGIGPGNYNKYTELSFNEFYLADWTSPEGLPPTNVLLESQINAGILGVLTVVLFWLSTIRRLRRLPKTEIKLIFLGTITIMAVVMQIESTYLRPYLWIFFGIIYGLTDQPKVINEEDHHSN